MSSYKTDLSLFTESKIDLIKHHSNQDSYIPSLERMNIYKAKSNNPVINYQNNNRSILDRRVSRLNPSNRLNVAESPSKINLSFNTS
mmetsp:Transcript_31339/g.30861  ORF Transcript_31339/g.30861 Transcript_31339/m.30861 type:complete len:87 (+) Transcript_31339:686-946(+)